MNGSLPLLKGTGAATELRAAITFSREAFDSVGHSSAASTCTSRVLKAFTSAFRELTSELRARTRSSGRPYDDACASLVVASSG